MVGSAEWHVICREHWLTLCTPQTTNGSLSHCVNAMSSLFWYTTSKFIFRNVFRSSEWESCLAGFEIQLLCLFSFFSQLNQLSLTVGSSEWRENRKGHHGSPLRYWWFSRSQNWVSGVGTYNQWMLMGWAASTYWTEASGICHNKSYPSELGVFSEPKRKKDDRKLPQPLTKTVSFFGACLFDIYGIHTIFRQHAFHRGAEWRI